MTTATVEAPREAKHALPANRAGPTCYKVHVIRETPCDRRDSATPLPAAQRAWSPQHKPARARHKSRAAPLFDANAPRRLIPHHDARDADAQEPKGRG